MREMPAAGKVEAEEGIARIEQREKYRLVHLAARIGLHIGEVAPEQLLGALDGKVFHLVSKFAATVIALARIALGILVGEDRPCRFEHGGASDVLAGNQLDPVTLATQLAADRAVAASAAEACGLSLRAGLSDGRSRQARYGD